MRTRCHLHYRWASQRCRSGGVAQDLVVFGAELGAGLYQISEKGAGCPTQW